MIIKKILTKVLSIILLFFLAAAANATNCVPFGPGPAPAPGYDPLCFENTGSHNTVTALATDVTNWFLSIAAGLAVLFLIIGGIYYLTAAGDDSRMQEGKKIMTYAIIGLIVVLISYSVVLTVNAIIFGP